METQSPQPDLVELEIGAFMGPHIKRARIALVLIGVFYAVSAYLDYGDIARLRDALAGYEGRHNTAFDELQSRVSTAYEYIVLTIVVGVANIALAGIGGKKTTLAMYIAMALFVVHSGFTLVLTQGLLVTSVVWWMIAITLGLGFQAAVKAERLRRTAGR